MSYRYKMLTGIGAALLTMLAGCAESPANYSGPVCSSIPDGCNENYYHDRPMLAKVKKPDMLEHIWVCNVNCTPMNELIDSSKAVLSKDPEVASE